MIPFKPKKKFGQNFLINKNLSTKIASYIDVKNCDSLIEIGPGLGSLTKEIINIDIAEKKFIEIDREDSKSILPEKRIKNFNEFIKIYHK